MHYSVETPQNCHTFVLFDDPNTGNFNDPCFTSFVCYLSSALLVMAAAGAEGAEGAPSSSSSWAADSCQSGRCFYHRKTTGPLPGIQAQS